MSAIDYIPTRHQLTLQRGARLSLRDAAGTAVSALEGCVWITEERNPRDVVLNPGESYRLAGKGLSLVEALSRAQISISFAASARAVPSRDGEIEQAVAAPARY